MYLPVANYRDVVYSGAGPKKSVPSIGRNWITGIFTGDLAIFPDVITGILTTSTRNTETIDQRSGIFVINLSAPSAPPLNQIKSTTH